MRFSSRAFLFCVVSCLLGTAHARAETPEPSQLVLQAPQARPEATRGWLQPGALAVSAALLPSFFLHGSGAFTIGDRKSARRLRISEGAGLAAFLAAGALVVATGTSRRLIGSLAPVMIGGFGLFMIGWLADLYAASTGGRVDHAPSFAPTVEAELGYLYVHDPQFRYGSFLVAQAELRRSAFRASPSAHLAMDDDNQRLGLEFGYRPYGRTDRRSSSDGSYGELVSALRYHRFGSDGFSVITPEWRLDGRLSLLRVGPSLAGSFVEGQLGAALELYDFAAPGVRIADNAFGLLLARFGFGVYFGDGAARSGEALLYYDHRHDDFAAGLGGQGIGSGVLGHIGLRGHYYVTRSWGLSGLAEMGAAFVAGLSLRYRLAPQEAG